MSFDKLKKDSLALFRDKKFGEALCLFEYTIEKIEQRDPEIEDLLREKEQTIPLSYEAEKRNIYCLVMVCIYQILTTNQIDVSEARIHYFQKFNHYLEKYFLLAEQTTPGDLRKWSENILINLFEYSLKLSILEYAADMKEMQQQRNSLQQRVRVLYRSFTDNFCVKGAFKEEPFIAKYQDILYFERGNVNRSGHSGQNYLNALWLAELFLQPDMVAKNAGTIRFRAAVMNLLSELVLYSPVQIETRGRYSREQQALQWLDLCLEEDPGNVFANERKNQLVSFITSAEQINRFKHDAISKIESIRGTIKKVKPLFDSDREVKALQSAEANINFITNSFRLTSRENPRIRNIDLNTIFNSFDDREINKEIRGRKRPIESDAGYLLLILENLIKNSKEAYGDKCPKTVILSFDYDDKAFTVKDFAGGIPEELQRQNKLFEPYVSTKGIFQNAGIGLASASEACKLINADLTFHTIENEEGSRGTEFSVKLREHEED